MSAETPEVLPAVADPVPTLTPETTLPPGVKPSSNYLAAVELGHVLAKSGYYRDARDPAQAAVKVMIGLDLGVSPTSALQAIHTHEEDGRIVFLTEAKLLAAAVKMHPLVEYKIVERTGEKVIGRFLRRTSRDAEWEAEGPDVTWTIEHAKSAVKGFAKKPTWQNLPAVMLTWRVLAEGFRLYFPDVLAGGSVYALEEFDRSPDSGGLRDALEPPKAQPLTDDKATELKARMKAAHEALQAINATRVPPGLYANMLAGAEHSHELLEARAAHLEDLLATERRYVELCGKLDESTYPATERKAIVERAERRSSGRERIDVIEKALADAPKPEPEAKPEGGSDAPGE